MPSLSRLRAACVAHSLTQLIRIRLCGHCEHAKGHPTSSRFAIDWLSRTGDLDAATFEFRCGLILNQDLTSEAIKLVDQHHIKQLAPGVREQLLERHALGEILSERRAPWLDIEWLNDRPALPQRVLATGAQLIVETDAFHLLFSTDPNVDCTAHITPTRLLDD